MTQQTRTICTLLSFVLGLAVVAPLTANTFTVNTTTDAVDATPGDGVAATAAGQCSLRAAVMEANALVGPHTIVLPAGTYNITLAGVSEDLAATGDLDLRVAVTIVGAGSNDTIIDARGLDRAFHGGFFPDSPVVLRDMTIRNGNAGAAAGGAVSQVGNSALVLERVRIHNSQGFDGGAIFHSVGDLTLTGCYIHDTTATGSAGAILKAGLGSVLMTDCRFQATNAGAHGGAAYITGADALTIEGCTFEDITADFDGGAVYRVGGSGQTRLTEVRFEDCSALNGVAGGYAQSGGGAITIEDCVFASNDAGTVGGGVFLGTFTGLTMRDTHIIDNTAHDNGGGIYITATADPLVFENVNISGNRSLSGSGGGILASTTGPATLHVVHITHNRGLIAGGGAHFLSQSSFVAEDCLFLDNTAQSGSGGGLHASVVGGVVLRDCDISGNYATNDNIGGGLLIASNGATLEGCLISHNTTTGPVARAGGAYLNSGATGASITNCTFSGNTTTLEGGALAFFLNTTITNCTFADNEAGFAGSTFWVLGPNNLIQNCILAEGIGGTTCTGVPLVSGGNNIDEEGACGLVHVTDMNGVDPRIGPLQDNGGAMDTHALLGGSPAIDTGGNVVCPGADQRGVARPQDGDDNGVAACDIGAFEFAADCNDNGLDDIAEIAMRITPDCNHNNIPDNCESPDVDGDGLYDICDSCIDSDGDGYGDQGYPGNTCPEDGCPTDPTKAEPGVCGCGVVDTDTDGDGVLDCVDNCPTVQNADQADSDGNGIGDACEASPGPAAVPGCGACGVGLYPMIPLMLLGLLRRRRR